MSFIPFYARILNLKSWAISLHELACMPCRILAALDVFAKCNPRPGPACIMEVIRRKV
jgi:hypothetical protein